MMPQKKKRPRMMVRLPSTIECPGHCKWVRTQYLCAIRGRAGHECVGIIEAHHVESRGSGGGDEQVCPLCTGAHSEGHTKGWDSFAKKYGVDLAKMAADLWRADTYHRGRYMQKQHTQSDRPGEVNT